MLPQAAVGRGGGCLEGAPPPSPVVSAPYASSPRDSHVRCIKQLALVMGQDFTRVSGSEDTRNQGVGLSSCWH